MDFFALGNFKIEQSILSKETTASNIIISKFNMTWKPRNTQYYYINYKLLIKKFFHIITFVKKFYSFE